MTREEAIEYGKEQLEIFGGLHHEFILMAIEALEQPTADVVEVVHGEWIKMDKRGKNVQCSKCGNTLDLRGVNAGRGDANYCPNCGAKMSTQSNAFSTH